MFGGLMSQIQNALTARRFSTQEVAQIEIYGRIGKIMAKMSNLSTSGAFFEILSPNALIKEGDLARFTVRLQSINKIHIVDCEVIWANLTGLGVRFLRRDELQEKLVLQFSR